jgi:hypothetical protein
MYEACKSVGVVRTRIPPTILLRSGNDVPCISYPLYPSQLCFEHAPSSCRLSFWTPFHSTADCDMFCMLFCLWSLSCIAHPRIQCTSHGLAIRCYCTPCEKQVTNKQPMYTDLFYCWRHGGSPVGTSPMTAIHKFNDTRSTVKIRSFLNKRLTEDSLLSVGRAVCQCREKCLVMHVAIPCASSLANDRDK